MYFICRDYNFKCWKNTLSIENTNIEISFEENRVTKKTIVPSIIKVKQTVIGQYNSITSSNSIPHAEIKNIIIIGIVLALIVIYCYVKYK